MKTDFNTGCTEVDLQLTLCDEIKELLAQVHTTNANGDEVVGFSVYPQQLPQLAYPPEGFEPQEGGVSAADDEEQLVPYVQVVMESSETERAEDPWIVSFVIVVAVHDADDANQGHRMVSLMLERIANRFIVRPLLGRYWMAQPHMRKELQVSDYPPFYYGTLQIMFTQPKQAREDYSDDGGFIVGERAAGLWPFPE